MFFLSLQFATPFFASVLAVLLESFSLAILAQGFGSSQVKVSFKAPKKLVALTLSALTCAVSLSRTSVGPVVAVSLSRASVGLRSVSSNSRFVG